MSRDRDNSFYASPDRMQSNQATEVIRITPDLLSEISGTSIRNLSDLLILDLHMKDRKGKIRRIEQMHRLPNLRQLNFSFNAIVAIEGLERLHNLLELNLAENDIAVIENLASLRSLEKLNLSGNKIKRIPESISQLSRLTHLRIASNQLEVSKDLHHLGKLPKLEKLRIDRNPFSSKSTALFAVHCISSLVELDRVAVTQDHRDTAARMFGTSVLSQLRSQLAEEESKLSRMRSDINRSPDRQQAQRRLAASGRSAEEFAAAQRELDQEEFLTAQKLQNIRTVEAQAARLRAEIESLSEAGNRVFSEVSQSLQRSGNNVSFLQSDSPESEELDTSVRSRPPPPPAPQRYSSPVAARTEHTAVHSAPQSARGGGYASAGNDAHTPSRYTSGPSTPAATSRTPGAASTTPISALAAQEMSKLSDQLESLAGRLLATEKEKNSLQKQLEVSKQIAARQAQIATATTTASAASIDSGYSHRESDLNRLNQLLQSQLKDTQDSLAKAVAEAAESRDQQLRTRDELEVAHAEVRRNAVQRDTLKQELEIIRAENEKIRKETLELRRGIIENDSLTTAETYNRMANGSAAEQWRQHESRVEIAAQRSELEGLRQEVGKLQRDLEKSMRETTQATEARLLADTEVEVMRGKVMVSEEVARGNKNRIAELENDLRRMKSRLEEASAERGAFEEECARLSTSLAIQEAEMDAYFKARDATPAKPRTSGTARSSSALSGREGGNLGLFQSPMKSRVRPSEDASTQAPGAVNDVYDIASDEETGSDDSGPVRPGQLHSGRKPTPKRVPKQAEGPYNRPFYGTQPDQMPAKFSVSQLEVAAAEVMALVLMQEIEANTPAPPASTALSRGLSVHHKTNQDVAAADRKLFLKDACIRAALRVIHSSTSMVRQAQHDTAGASAQATHAVDEDSVEEINPNETLSSSIESGEFGIGESKRSERPHTPRRDIKNKPTKSSKKNKQDVATRLGQVEIHPFHALGNRDFLSRVVAETHAGMATIEDSDAIKQEVKLLENLVRELETKSLTMESSLATKQHSLGALQKHCDDAKSQAEAALNELDFLAQRLQDSRDNITKTDTEHTLVKRELELVRHALQESVAMSEIEHANIHTARSRLVELKHELSETEQRILICKESCLKEEDKLRSTKATATDQLRLLQMELSKFQSDFKVKQQLVEGLEQQRRSLVEEIEIKTRDSSLQLSMTAKEHDEEARKLNNVRAEVRVQKLEVDQLVSRRRQLENEVQRLQETFSSESAKVEAEELEAKRRLTNYEKALQSVEKKLRDGKSKLAGFEGEETILRHSVEELRRQQGDLERAAEQRRRTNEEEFTLVQNKVQVALRASRQADGEIETKRAELEGLTMDLRSVERRLEELKRQAREQEMLLDSHRDTAKVLDLDRDRKHRDFEAYRKEEEDLRHQAQLLRTTIDHETRTDEELRRKLVALKVEETSLKESEMRMRAELSQARKEVDKYRTELDGVCAASERERRALADIHTKKSAVEAEMNRLQDELRFEEERVAKEAQRRIEVESANARCQEDLNRMHKALSSLNKRVEDATRREEDLRRQETALKSQLEKLRLETEGLTNAQANEKTSVSAAREELRDINLEIRRNKESLRLVQQEVQTGQLGLEALQAQRDHLEDIKDELTGELNRLRESSRLELLRTEKLENTYSEVQQRLTAVRTDLTLTEQTYEKVRNLSTEEEQRVQGQRRALRQTLDELSKVEKAVSEAHQQMYEERQRALLEIGQLGQAKQSAQAHIFLTTEAQRRLDSRAALPNHGSTIAQKTRLDSATNNVTGSLNMPDYLLSHNTNTLYRATPVTATSGIKLDSAPTSTWRDRMERSVSPPRHISPLRSSREGLGINPGAGARPVSHPVNITSTGKAVGDTPLTSLQEEVARLKRQSAAAINTSTGGSRN